jgi:peptidoglycan/xylan/chitin deacetylase (PgdA/CDA1 family)
MDPGELDGWPAVGLVAASPAARDEPAVLLCFDDMYRSFADLAAPLLRRRGWRALGFICRDWIFAAPRAGVHDGPACLSWPELATLSDVLLPANHSAGLHGRREGLTMVNELVARDRAGDAAARTAFLTDTAAGEAATGHTGLYAWPFGACPDPAPAWAAEAGLRLSFGTVPGVNGPDTPRHRLHRNVVRPGLDRQSFLQLLG